MNVVDSSGWLEYLAGAPNADFFAPAIENPKKLVVPAITIYEVFKHVRRQRGEGDALQAVAVMQQGTPVPVTASLALRAAELSLEHGLPMADSLILATARTHRATLWTQDEDFRGVEGVKYVAK